MSELPSGLKVHIADSEALARFCTSSSWVARTTGRVKHQAFLPAPDDDTSVYRVDGIASQEIWDLAARYFVNSENKAHKHHGAAVVTTGLIRKSGIDAIAHEGPPRHANLRGWPRDQDPVIEKSRRKEIATKIADKASYLPNS